MMPTTARSTSSMVSDDAPSLPRRASPTRSSSVVKTSHALRNGVGVFFSPIPTTVRPLSRMRLARRVKSLSLDTRQNPSTELV